MKDFRNSPYNSSRQNYSPQEPKSDSSGFVKFALVAGLVIGLTFFFVFPEKTDKEVDMTPTQQEETSIFQGIVDSMKIFDEFKEEFEIAMREIEEESGTDSTPVEDDSLGPGPPGLPEVGEPDPNSTDESNPILEGTVEEYDIVPTTNGHYLYGIFVNESNVVVGKIPIVAEYNNGSGTTKGYISIASLQPGQSSPFTILVKDWDKKSSFVLKPDLTKHYDQSRLDVEYEVQSEKWKVETIQTVLTGKFIYKSDFPIRFSQLIYVIRNEKGRIMNIKSHYLVEKENKYTMKPKSEKDFKIHFLGEKKIPKKYDVYFSFMPESKD